MAREKGIWHGVERHDAMKRTGVPHRHVKALLEMTS